MGTVFSSSLLMRMLWKKGGRNTTYILCSWQKYMLTTIMQGEHASNLFKKQRRNTESPGEGLHAWLSMGSISSPDLRLFARKMLWLFVHLAVHSIKNTTHDVLQLNHESWITVVNVQITWRQIETTTSKCFTKMVVTWHRNHKTICQWLVCIWTFLNVPWYH